MALWVAGSAMETGGSDAAHRFWLAESAVADIYVESCRVSASALLDDGQRAADAVQAVQLDLAGDGSRLGRRVVGLGLAEAESATAPADASSSARVSATGHRRSAKIDSPDRRKKCRGCSYHPSARLQPIPSSAAAGPATETAL
jgi:hypothetical protein